MDNKNLGRGAESRTPATRPPAAHSTVKLHPGLVVYLLILAKPQDFSNVKVVIAEFDLF